MRTARYALLMLAFLAPAGLVAQMGGPGGGPRGWGRGPMGGPRRMPTVEDELKELTQQLKLTDEQKPKVKAILQDQHDQMRRLMEESSGTPEENRSKMREIHENSSAKIRELLTDEQKTKYDKLLEERRRRMEERRRGPEGGPPPEPQ